MTTRIKLSVLAVVVALSLPLGVARADSQVHQLSRSDSLAAGMPLQVSQAVEDANDPLESVNRAIFGFNEGLQDYVLRPVAGAYNTYVPATPRRAVKNMFENAKAPVIFVNDLLQFEFERALTTFMRAFINTTFGAVGIMDLASEMGFEKHKEDFGQTLGVWGVGEGFYVVLPVLGPSNPRDAIGRLLIDSYFDPLAAYLDNIDEEEINLALDAIDGFVEFADVVDELDQIKKTSVDYYAAIRSLYRQKRKAEISNGKNLDLPPIPDLAPEIRGEYSPVDGAVAAVKAAN